MIYITALRTMSRCFIAVCIKQCVSIFPFKFPFATAIKLSRRNNVFVAKARCIKTGRSLSFNATSHDNRHVDFRPHRIRIADFPVHLIKLWKTNNYGKQIVLSYKKDTRLHVLCEKKLQL